MADIMEGELFWGSYHPKYGERLKISRYEKGLARLGYFSSDHFKGIGLKTASKNRGPLWRQYY